MNVMDGSLNFWNTSKRRQKYLQSVLFKTTLLPPWFLAQLSKALEDVLNSLIELVALGNLEISCPNAE